MSVATKEVTKCSKRTGEYCRLHNPAPSTGMATVEDVFKKVAQESKARKTFTSPAPKNDYNFQPVTEPRTLPDGIPMLVKEHEELSLQGLSHLTDEEKLALKGYTGFAAAVCNNVLQGKGYEYYQEAPLWKESTGPCDFVNQEDLISYFETIDKVLEKRHPDRRTIYRGIPIYDSLHDEIGASIGKKLHVKDTGGLVEGLKEYYKPGKVFNNKTYWSSTSSAYVAAERSGNTVGTKQNYWEKAEISGIVFELHTNAGLDITGARSRTSFEREVLLPRDTYFKVVNVHVKPEEYKTVSGYDNRRNPEELTHENFKSLAVVVQMVEVDKHGNEITHSNKHVPSGSPKGFVPDF